VVLRDYTLLAIWEQADLAVGPLGNTLWTKQIWRASQAACYSPIHHSTPFHTNYSQQGKLRPATIATNGVIMGGWRNRSGGRPSSTVCADAEERAKQKEEKKTKKEKKQWERKQDAITITTPIGSESAGSPTSETPQTEKTTVSDDGAKVHLPHESPLCIPSATFSTYDPNDPKHRELYCSFMRQHQATGQMQSWDQLKISVARHAQKVLFQTYKFWNETDMEYMGVVYEDVVDGLNLNKTLATEEWWNKPVKRYVEKRLSDKRSSVMSQFRQQLKCK
jgi:hypothetical protein